MNTTQFLGAFLLPLRNAVIVLAAVVFWMLGAMGLLIAYALQNILPFIGFVGLLLLFAVMVPALVGYLVQLVDATSRRLAPPVADAELFMMLGRDWRLFPLAPAAALYVLYSALLPWSATAAVVITFALAVLFLPLSLMMFSVTGSRVECVNPLAMFRLFVRLWPDYGWMIPALLIMAIVGGLAKQLDWPSAVLLALVIYFSIVFALLCGRLLNVVDVAGETAIGLPREPSPGEVKAAVDLERNKVLNHAYALISRGNRDGGFAHIDAYLDSCEEAGQTSLWFYFSMQAWDLGDAPLFYAQGLITRLLDRGDNAAAMKVLTGSLHRNESFRPRPEDRQRLQEIAEQTGNLQISRALARMP